jgi:hypothetical protein
VVAVHDRGRLLVTEDDLLRVAGEVSGQGADRCCCRAVVEQITAEVAAALDALDLDRGSATAALRRWLDTSWGLMERYPVLLSPAMPVTPPEQELERHEPVTGRLASLIRHGQRVGEFDRRLPPAWLTAATIALGHAAGQEVAAGRMTTRQAGDAYTTAVMRVYCADPSAGDAG